jgi:hypothetical protein
MREGNFPEICSPGAVEDLSLGEFMIECRTKISVIDGSPFFDPEIVCLHVLAGNKVIQIAILPINNIADLFRDIPEPDCVPTLRKR